MKVIGNNATQSEILDHFYDACISRTSCPAYNDSCERNTSVRLTKTIPERRIQYCNSFDAFVKAPGDNQECARARKETYSYRNLDTWRKSPLVIIFQVPSFQRIVLHSIVLHVWLIN
jgi:hypothetical protein